MATGLYIAMDFKPNLGGIAEHTHQMVRHLTELGQQITVLTPALPGGNEFDRTCGYRVIRFNKPSPTSESPVKGLGRFVAVAKMTKILFTTIHRVRPDYLILDQWDALTAVGIILASRLMGIPYFVFAHGYDFTDNRNWIFLRKRTIRSATCVIPVSNYIRSFVLADEPHLDNIAVIHNGFDYREINSFRKRSYQGRFPRVEATFPTGGKSVLSVSRLVRWKAIHQIIKAMPIIVSKVPDARYVVIGSGKYEPHLRQLAASVSAKDSITFLGPLTGDEKFECFDRCDVFALTSEREGFGIVYMEAMAFGKPVVGGSLGGASEAIIHEEDGLLVDPNNIKEIADAIIFFLKNPDEAYKFGENGRGKVETELNWQASAAKLLSLIHNAL